MYQGKHGIPVISKFICGAGEDKIFKIYSDFPRRIDATSLLIQVVPYTFGHVEVPVL